jgi:hypothetical protein
VLKTHGQEVVAAKVDQQRTHAKKHNEREKYLRKQEYVGTLAIPD